MVSQLLPTATGVTLFFPQCLTELFVERNMYMSYTLCKPCRRSVVEDAIQVKKGTYVSGNFALILFLLCLGATHDWLCTCGCRPKSQAVRGLLLCTCGIYSVIGVGDGCTWSFLTSQVGLFECVLPLSQPEWFGLFGR